MSRRVLPGVCVVLATLAGGWNPLAAADKAPSTTQQAWTFEQAMGQLMLNRSDPYLQYVALQLARSAGKTKAIEEFIEGPTWRRGGPDRQVDLFDLFTGALAVQESLQLDTMRGKSTVDLSVQADPKQQIVPIAKLKGPEVKSHPWDKMLAAGGKQAQVAGLALSVPHDQLFVRFRSLTKLVEASEAGDLWGDHLSAEASQSAQSQDVGRRIKSQLAVKADPLSRPFYDMVVQEVALTGSDLFFREGTDVTILFAVKQPDVFRARMDGFLQEAQKSHADAVRTTGNIQGVEYVQLSTPDRSVHVFSAYPRPELHVRSNSRVGLERVLEAIAGKRADGSTVVRLGATTEFQYIRTLMPAGAKEEDGLVYLSDPFIRRLVGPECKLTERRRMVCYNHLRMIGHASMLFRTQFGRAPESLGELASTGCAPGVFGEGNLLCPCGGRYSLSADKSQGVCSHHGHSHSLIPCCEIPVARVTKEEGEEYGSFVKEYNQYWRQFFDPIAIRIQMTPKRYRAETIILPLIDNSIYTGMAQALKGKPTSLETLPVPDRTIFSVGLRVNKEMIPQESLKPSWLTRELFGLDIENMPDENAVRDFLLQGLGDQVSLHVYDSTPMFDLSLTRALGELTRSFRGSANGRMSNEFLPVGFLISSLNAPVYLAIPVRDTQIVDKFLDWLDRLLLIGARQGRSARFFDLDHDFYKFTLGDSTLKARCYNVSLGPIKWRLFFARIDDGLYIASKPFVLEDLAVAAAKRKTAGEKVEAGPTAHAMLRIRADHWNAVLPEYKLGWEESNRVACLNNVGPLSSVARAIAASGTKASADDVQRMAEALHTVRFFCPDGGHYERTPDGKFVTCSIHGSAGAPRQLAAPPAGSVTDRWLKQFTGLTAELTFLEDGLHAVVIINRK